MPPNDFKKVKYSELPHGPMAGLVHVYTGNGKGKTTAALGLGFRALGRGYTVHFIQFMKYGPGYGEILSADRYPGMTVKQFGTGKFIQNGEPSEEDIRKGGEGLEYARSVMDGLPENGEGVLMSGDAAGDRRDGRLRDRDAGDQASVPAWCDGPKADRILKDDHGSNPPRGGLHT
jgi:hypothetical protein